ncbi:MAG TPA: Lrp/AsnC family transcriptional regulator [Desulfobacterales bacterium]|nr:Lrp/AsnC family transcriptional regulator [Desulfobacterales bacterium]
MPKAYVLINVKSQHRVKETLVALRRKKGVASADAIFGPYDVIAVIEGQDLEDLSNTVIGDLYDLGHIKNSTTCIAID